MPVPKVQICDVGVTPPAPGVVGLAPMREVCLGRVAPDPVMLAAVPKFAAFLVGGTPPPASKSWVNDAAKASLKQMYGNDQWGDCVIASVGHGVGVSSANESGTAVVGTTNEIVSEYHRICGAGDNGCVIADVKNTMMTGGVSVGGKRRKIDGYASIPPANKLAVQTAILIAGGGVNIGFNVPAEWMGSATYDGAIWDVPRRFNFIGGHDVRAVGYDERGVQFSTWGIVVTMTWAAMADSRIVDEMYVELEQDWNTDGTAPSGIDTAGLVAALAAFKAGKVPDWNPVSPPPVPPAPPSPPVPPAPGTGLTGTETAVYAAGRLVSRTFVPSVAPALPNVDADTHEIDLSHIGPIRRAIVKRKILAAIEDNDHADYSVKGDKIVLTRKAGVDWNGFLGFLTGLLPLIEAIIRLFGGA